MQLCVALAFPGKGGGVVVAGRTVFLVLYSTVYVAATLLSVTAGSAACSSAAAGAGSKCVVGLFQQHLPLTKV